MQIKQNNLVVFFLTVVAGFLGGVLGGALVNNSYSFYQTASPSLVSSQLSTTTLGNFYSISPQLSQDDKDLKDLPFSEFYNNEVFLVRSSAKKLFTFEDYSRAEILGYGSVLTDDGWIITTQGEWEKIPLSQLRIINRGKVYSIEKKVKDLSTGVIYLKVKTSGREQLVALPLADSEEITYLDKLVSFDKERQIQRYLVKGIVATEKIKNSETLSKRIILDSSALPGQPLFNEKGEVAAIASASQEAIPINYLKNQIKNLLKEQKVKRVYLGVNYVDLDNPFLVDGENFNFGALLYNEAKKRAVEKGSPAERAGLRYGDIIFSIEGEEIGVKKDLSEIIQEYHPGVEVELLVLRNGQEKKISVKLGELGNKNN